MRRRVQLAGYALEYLRTDSLVRLIGRSFSTMAMEDEGLAEEIPLATAQHVRAQLGSLRDLDPRAGDLSRSRKDPVPSLRRSSADQQTDA